MDNLTKPTFYGLLYADERERDHTNLKLKQNEDPIDIYLRCASTCAASIRYHGHTFKLITNDQLSLERRLSSLGVEKFEIVGAQFKLDLPPGIPFHSAHFKLEVYEMFGLGKFGPIVGLIDLDSAMVSQIDLECIQPGSLLGYDILDQILPEIGEQRFHSDIELIGAEPNAPMRWLGGEFILGYAEDFLSLSKAIAPIWPHYTREFKRLHHKGDEMVVAAAITTPEAPKIVDAGARNSIARWWTCRTNHVQPTFASIRHRSLLHLPGDKPFLAEFSSRPFQPKEFLSAFEKSAGSKLFSRRMSHTAQRLLQRDHKYVPRLT